MAGAAFVYGAAFGLLPIGWTVFAAMLLYNMTVETGQFTVIRRSIGGLSGDARVQAVLIGFCVRGVHGGRGRGRVAGRHLRRDAGRAWACRRSAPR